ncbi:hypothetical protein [Jiella marina]|uniref:hypothetical protein n=1 Tax=Jiella sp. LLJ827 TaxID=2917712 RepID=UPI002100AE8E|nr:hypothetical protein [Jiella sp. LLJ827]MCQ0988089.1 hypothetical protein [Jiella sp. LLJ827]
MKTVCIAVLSIEFGLAAATSSRMQGYGLRRPIPTFALPLTSLVPPVSGFRRQPTIRSHIGLGQIQQGTSKKEAYTL